MTTPSTSQALADLRVKIGSVAHVQEAVRGMLLEEILADITALAGLTARPLSEYHEDFGPVTWWAFPVREPSYIGDPSWDNWPGYHTHWTPHPAIPVLAEALTVTKAPPVKHECNYVNMVPGPGSRCTVCGDTIPF
jgi:hypothetical protein